MNIPTEEQEQIALVGYLEVKGIKHTAIPNSTYTKSWNQKRKNKAMGLKAGLCDMLLIINNKLLFIEMKRTKRSQTSPEQKEWIKELNKCNGVEAVICKGFLQAKEVVDRYLKS